MSSYYISTPIYYVNDAPHLGHAYTTIAADALARFHRMRGDDTHYLTGTDEHGLKIEQAAAARGLGPQALADEVVERFRATWTNLDISNDDFIRTTEPRHKKIVAELWRKMVASGDIYLGAYEGWYCVACEAYYPEGQLLEGKLCPTHKSPATWLSEPTYFFKLSRYEQPLLAYIEKHPGFIQPEAYRNEVVSFLKSGLRDLSISRTTFSWGIPVPDDPKHVIYVWIDALTNYYSALSDVGGVDLRGRFWNPEPGRSTIVHLLGKDILKFHAVYWPCMLMSAGLPLPSTILCHGWWTVRGEKISKSMPATRVDPNQLAADLGSDALRYFLLREVPLGLDGDFSYEALLQRYNSDLANDLGNLVARSLTMATKLTDGVVPRVDAHDLESVRPFNALLNEFAIETTEAYLANAPSRALEATWRSIREVNRFIDSSQPWILARDPARRGELDVTIRAILEGVLQAAKLIAPVLPATARSICKQLGYGADADEVASTWVQIPLGTMLTAGMKLEPLGPMFPRLDDKRQAELLERWIPADARAAAAPPAPPARAAAGSAPPSLAAPPAKAAPTAAAGDPGDISFDEFGKLDLRVALVTAAEAIKGAKKLLRLELDIGEAAPRQVVAGIAERYAPAELIGKKVIFLANLKPATIRGVTSAGMVLAAGGEQILGLSAVDVDVPPGTRVR